MAKKYAGTFLGTGKGLVTIGSHCYGYSGEVSVPGSLTEMLSFSVGKEYIVAEIQMASDGASNNDFTAEMKLNGETIFTSFMASDTAPYPTGPQPVNVLIPPNSTFSFALLADTGTRIWTVSLVGRIYDA